MKNLAFNIHTLGCKVNQYDSISLKDKLLTSGLSWAEKNADLSIVNTCAVTQTAIKKVKTLINRVGRENPKAKVIVTGCAVKVYGDEFDNENILLIKNTIELFQFIDTFICHSRVGGKPESKRTEWIPIFTTAGAGQAGMTKKGNRARYTIKIQDGCDQYCTYCIVPYARGGLMSRDPDEVIEEIKKAVRAGYEEVVLSGIHLGKYGGDKLEGRSLPAGEAGQKSKEHKLVGLLNELMKIDGLKRIRLSSIEVTEVGDELIKFFVQYPKMCRHLHLPLQSGSDKILKLMNRPYNSKYFEDKVKYIRKAMPDIAITTDVIVGFPGETENDFRDTVKTIKRIRPSRLHVFSFSPHEKTPAAKFPGRVASDAIKKRSKFLRGLNEELKEGYEKKFAGKELAVLVERKIGGNYIGKTEYYFDIRFGQAQIVGDKSDIMIGKIVNIKQSK